MAEIGVAHLVRARNGIQPVRTFLDSYKKTRANTKHDLIILFKGFKSSTEAEEYRECLRPFNYKEFFVSDLGYDLRAYGKAARHFKYSHFCFLNSFSVLLDEGWLGKMAAIILRSDVGLVGATGSWESMYSNLLAANEADKNSHGSFPASLRRTLRCQLNRYFFYPFPNHHIRTNAFMLSRETMLKVWPAEILTKKRSYLFENGKRSLTQRVLNLALKVFVVGKDGVGYEGKDWADSNTFRQSKQENLLVADNQTRQYADADFETRKYLARLTWGNRANPAH